MTISTTPTTAAPTTTAPTTTVATATAATGTAATTSSGMSNNSNSNNSNNSTNSQQFAVNPRETNSNFGNTGMIPLDGNCRPEHKNNEQSNIKLCKNMIKRNKVINTKEKRAKNYDFESVDETEKFISLNRSSISHSSVEEDIELDNY